MKAINIMLVIMCGLTLMACGGGITSESDQDISDLNTQEQAELVAVTLTSDQGGVGDDIALITQAGAGQSQQQLQSPNAAYGYSVSVNIDFYDAQDILQDAYDPDTTDRIDYQSRIQGEITNGTGYFTELNIDNQSDFTMDDIQSRTAWINGVHTNHSSYSRTNFITQAEIHFQLDCELDVTDLTVDLDAEDTFPESGTIEGSLTGSYERIGPLGRYTRQFNFHFVATYLGDNTAEVELTDGTTFIVRLDTHSVENIE